MTKNQSIPQNTKQTKMSDLNQKEVNKKILSELANIRSENNNIRSENATIRSEKSELRKMFEELMKSEKGKEQVLMEDSTQQGRLQTNQAEIGGSHVGSLYSPNYYDHRGPSFPQMRIPPPHLQFESNRPPMQPPRNASMGMEPGNINFTPTKNIDHIMTARSRGVKVDFPRFNGENLRGWLRKCHRYFMLNPMSNVEKILLASMHFEGKAEYWYMDNY